MNAVARRNAFEAASTKNVNIGSWRPSLRSIDAEVLRDAPTVRARARDLVRNNPTARQAVRISRQGTIGAHLRLVLNPDYKFLGIDHADGVMWARTVERVWEQYAHGPSCWLDAGRRFSFTELMGLAHDQDFIDGECLVACEWDQNRPWNTCFQVVDVDRLSNPFGRPETTTLKGGVELDQFSAPVGYHIRQAHPADIAVIGSRPYVWDLVPRETPWFRPIMMHSFDPIRAGQTRGISEFASVIHALKLGKEYAEQELSNATVRAGFVAVLTSALNANEAMASLAEGWMAGREGEEGESLNPIAEMAFDALKQTVGYYNELDLSVAGQKIPKLSPGDDLKFLGNNTPGSNYADYVMAQIRNVAAGLGVDPTGLSQDYSQTSYSSAKMSYANNGRGYEIRRARLTRMIGMPIVAGWMEEAVQADRIPMPKGMSKADYYEARDALVRGSFITAGKPIIEPLKERQAQQLGINMGVETLQSVCSDEGLVAEEQLEQLARENQMREELGLIPVGVPPPPEDEPPADDPPPDKKNDEKKDEKGAQMSAGKTRRKRSR
jgi:lambda family phage portal protein